jgi:MFS family permease
MKRLYYGWVVVATLFVVNFATQATGTLNLGFFIIPMGSDLGILRAMFGWLTTARALAGGASGLFLGRLLDRFGPRLLIAFASLVTGLCLIAIAFSNSTYQLFLIFAIVGMVGLSTPGGSILSIVPVAKWFVRRRGRAIALAALGLGLGAVVFVPVTQALIDGVGWRKAWLYLALISTGLTVPLAFIFLRRQPEDMGLRPDGDRDAPSNVSVSREEEASEVVWGLREALRTKAFWLLTTSFVLVNFALGGAIYRIPYWTEKGFDPQIVSWSFSADAAASSVMILVSGLVLDRVKPRFAAAAAFAGFACAVTLMLFGTTTLHLFASTVLFGLSIGVTMVAQTYLWAQYYGRTFLGTIQGVTLPALLAASAFGAPVVGYVYDYTESYDIAWQALIGIYVVAMVIMLLAAPPTRRQAG